MLGYHVIIILGCDPWNTEYGGKERGRRGIVAHSMYINLKFIY